MASGMWVSRVPVHFTVGSYTAPPERTFGEPGESDQSCSEERHRYPARDLSLLGTGQVVASWIIFTSVQV